MKKGKITYLYDALCGWCYGFSPVIKQLHQEYQSILDFSVISGGLFVGERIGPINKVAPYIRKGAYKSVEQRTGVKFGEGFLKHLFNEEDSLTMDSIYSAIALSIVKEEFPDKAVDFAHLLQTAIYSDGIDTIDLAAFTKYAVKMGCDALDFNTKMKSEEYLTKARQEFAFFKELPVNGFPALILSTEKGAVLLSNGYTSYEDLKKRLMNQGVESN